MHGSFGLSAVSASQAHPHEAVSDPRDDATGYQAGTAEHQASPPVPATLQSFYGPHVPLVNVQQTFPGAASNSFSSSAVPTWVNLQSPADVVEIGQDDSASPHSTYSSSGTISVDPVNAHGQPAMALPSVQPLLHVFPEAMHMEDGQATYWVGAHTSTL